MRIIQGWGMTETSPVAGIAHPPAEVPPDSEADLDWRMKSGRVIAGVQMRIVADDGTILPRDGEAVGEIEVRGPWITGSYHRDAAPEKFDDGWLRTGDIGTIDERGFFQITDRSKDVIKSGGEWISSVELEGLLAAAPGVIEVAVIGVPDEKWTERPLACVVGRDDNVDAGRARAVPGRQGRELAGAGELDLHRRGAEDERRQVRQEGAARPACARRLRDHPDQGARILMHHARPVPPPASRSR